MSHPFVIIIPAEDDQLRHEIEQTISRYAKVQSLPPTFDLDETILLIELAVGVTTITANIALITQFLLELRDRYKQQEKLSKVRVGKLAGVNVALDDTNAELLRRLLIEEDSHE